MEKGNGSKMCGKPRGHEPDQDQCCKLGACDLTCWASMMPSPAPTVPKWAVLKCCKCRWHVTWPWCTCRTSDVVSLLEESRWRVYFFNTVLSLWVTPSPHFLSFFPRLSLCGVAWFSSQHGEAWRLSAYQPGPFILLTTCHSSPSVDRGWFAPDWSFPFWLEWRSFILTSLFQTF